MITVKLPFRLKEPLLACGADLKGGFALAKEREAFLVDGFGDLADPDNAARYEKAVKKYIKELAIRPAVLACDLHPGYFSAGFAEAHGLKSVRRPPYKVQHHEAHIASAMVDNSIGTKVIGAAFDGTGYGSDGNIWGGEFFVGDAGSFRRVAHLKYAAMPGGELAIREPWRMALSYLYGAFGDRTRGLNMGPVKRLDGKNYNILKAMIDKGINAPLTSSVGRLFDGVACLVLSKDKASFEAELPIELEKQVSRSCDGAYDFESVPKNGVLIVDPSLPIKGVVEDIMDGADRATISAKFHNTVANIVLKTCSSLRKRFRIGQAVLSGGVFQNRYLTERSVGILKGDGFKVFTHRNVPTNDSGIAIGQIAAADARLRCA